MVEIAVQELVVLMIGGLVVNVLIVQAMDNQMLAGLFVEEVKVVIILKKKFKE
jgi:hypothetical protein